MQAAVWEEEIGRLHMNAILYLRYAMQFFWGKTLEEDREIAIGICLQGQHGPENCDSQETHILLAPPGRIF